MELAPSVHLRLAAGVAALAALWIWAAAGGGVADAATGAPDVTGKKYSDAQSAISGAGFTPVVSTVFGDRNNWSNCLVTDTQQRTVQPPPNSSGSAVKQILVALNCDAGVASATRPGNSAASPEGRAATAAAAASPTGSSS
jgi:hypothetical protein